MKTAPSNSGSPGSATGPWGLLAVTGLLLVVHLWPVLLVLSGIYENMPDFSHGYFVPLVSAYMVFAGWSQCRRTPLGTNRAGLGLVGLGLLLTVLCTWYEWALYPAGTGASMIGGFGIIAVVAGIAVALFGWSRTRVYLFPLCFLLLAVPYPDSLSEHLTVPMRNLISVMAEWCLDRSGVHVFREGNILQLANVSLGVEDACSGIRSLWASLASALAIAWFTGCMRGRMVLAVVVGLVLAVLQNLARVYLSGVLANRWGEAWAEGWRHELLGIMTLSIALLLLLWFCLRIAPASQPPDKAVVRPDWSYLARQKSWLAALAVMTAVAMVTQWGIRRHYQARDEVLLAREAARQPLEEFPAQLGTFSLDEATTAAWDLERQLPVLKPTDHYHGVYTGEDGTRFFVLLLYWDPLLLHNRREWVYPHSPNRCFPETGWTLHKDLPPDPALFDAEREFLLTRLYQRNERVNLLYYWNNRTFGQTQHHRKPSYADRFRALVQSWADPAGFVSAQYSAAIYTDASRSPDRVERAVHELAQALIRELPDFGLSPPDRKMDSSSSAAADARSASPITAD